MRGRCRHPLVVGWLEPATANRAPVRSMTGAVPGPDVTSTSSPPDSKAPMIGTSGVTWPAPSVDTTSTFTNGGRHRADRCPGARSCGEAFGVGAEGQTVPTMPPSTGITVPVR